ncbi:hypothetical protein RHSIM_Rhsim09G0083400 [Rhododendron simsii]|uniref:Fasciclin-like arabinogalactan protein 21 n=1 Tax=Rhododendron simsii TaxID=118357 RepID=A0A834GFP8_RHOSS|nr:hypothetical protein RHSIM_Rhsim09G0083400 [Rhododendron simsii]
MAAATPPLPLQFLIILASILLSTSTLTLSSFVPSPTQSPFPPPPSRDVNHANPTSLFSGFAPILSSLGFHGFSAAAPFLSNATTWSGPATIFAPFDSSLSTCSPSCSIPLLLREHTLPGLFPLPYLLTLPFATRIETLSPGKCLTITFSTHNNARSSQPQEVFVSGVKITRPDLYNDGVVAVHGLQGFISHLSPYSCDANKMSSLALPHPPPTAPFFLMRLMLNEAMLRLSGAGYGVVALALRVKYHELVPLQSMTVFALDDVSIFSGNGYAYVTGFRSHVVPDKLLMGADMAGLALGTALATLEPGKKLVVTNVKPTISINYVKIKRFDLAYNPKVVVHGLSLPFPHVHGDFGGVKKGRSGFLYRRDVEEVESMVEVEDHHHGL